MSINNKLTMFAQNELVLSYSDTERERIKASIEQLEKVLMKVDNAKEVKRFGSFTRNTILPRKYDSKSDIDLMLIFHTPPIQSIETYRNRILDVLNKAYPNSTSKKDFPTVKLELNHIMFDIVPAYCTKYILGGLEYYIPTSGGNWRRTIPNDINDNLASKNNSFGNNIVRNTIRLCKHWNASAGYPLESYLMEKEILNTHFWYGGDLYEKFLNNLENIAGTRSEVAQAIGLIRIHKRQNIEQRQLESLRYLLPGLK